MAKNQGNGRARWIVVALAVGGLIFNSGILYNDVGGLIFNSGILYNDVRHLKEEVAEVKQEIKDLRQLFIEMM
jgi:hypothetical protein